MHDALKELKAEAERLSALADAHQDTADAYADRAVALENSIEQLQKLLTGETQGPVLDDDDLPVVIPGGAKSQAILETIRTHRAVLRNGGLSTKELAVLTQRHSGVKVSRGLVSNVMNYLLGNTTTIHPKEPIQHGRETIWQEVNLG